MSQHRETTPGDSDGVPELSLSDCYDFEDTISFSKVVTKASQKQAIDLLLKLTSLVKQCEENGGNAARMKELIALLDRARYPVLQAPELSVLLCTTTPMLDSQYFECFTCLLVVLGNPKLVRKALLEAPKLLELQNSCWHGSYQSGHDRELIEIEDGLLGFLLRHAILRERHEIVSLLLAYGIKLPSELRSDLTCLWVPDSVHLWRLLNTPDADVLCVLCGPFAGLHNGGLVKCIIRYTTTAALLSLAETLRNPPYELCETLAHYMRRDQGEIREIFENWIPRIESMLYYNPNALDYCTPTPRME